MEKFTTLNEQLGKIVPMTGINFKTMDTVGIVEGKTVVVSGSSVWGSITGNINNQTDLQTQFATKQDTLVAGENITISGNVISATGGGGSSKPITLTTLLPESASTHTQDIYRVTTDNKIYVATNEAKEVIASDDDQIDNAYIGGDGMSFMYKQTILTIQDFTHENSVTGYSWIMNYQSNELPLLSRKNAVHIKDDGVKINYFNPLALTACTREGNVITLNEGIPFSEAVFEFTNTEFFEFGFELYLKSSLINEVNWKELPLSIIEKTTDLPDAETNADKIYRLSSTNKIYASTYGEMEITLSDDEQIGEAIIDIDGWEITYEKEIYIIKEFSGENFISGYSWDSGEEIPTLSDTIAVDFNDNTNLIGLTYGFSSYTISGNVITLDDGIELSEVVESMSWSEYKGYGAQLILATGIGTGFHWTSLTENGYSYDESSGAFAIKYLDENVEYNNNAWGMNSFAQGYNTTTMGTASHAEGYETTTCAQYSHAEGWGTTASGKTSHTEGDNTTTIGEGSHAEGGGTEAYGDYSHAEGSITKTLSEISHAEGKYTIASGACQHVQGKYNIADSTSAFIIGNGTAENKRSNAFSVDWSGNTIMQGSLTEGSGTSINSRYAHVEGFASSTSGRTTNGNLGAHAEGFACKAYGNYGAHAEGFNASAYGNQSHAEGMYTIANGNAQHVQGKYNVADLTSAFIIGNGTDEEARSNAFTVDWTGNTMIKGSLTLNATTLTENELSTIKNNVGSIVYNSGDTSYATKYYEINISTGKMQYYNNTASSKGAFAEGYNTQATSNGAHAEGENSIASGQASHAEGYSTATAFASHSEGQGTIANGQAQHVQGKFNVADTTSAFIIGNGTNNSNRSNAFTVDFNGNTTMAGTLKIGNTTLSEAQLIALLGLLTGTTN